MRPEILAYLKGGSGRLETYMTQAYNKTLYDHMKDPREGYERWAQENAKDFLDEAKHALHQVFVTEYRTILKDGLDSYKDLIKLGYPENQVLALLEHEPLVKWSKVLERLKEQMAA